MDDGRVRLVGGEEAAQRIPHWPHVVVRQRALGERGRVAGGQRQPVPRAAGLAGIADSRPIETIALERARAVVDTNLWGPVRTVRAVLPAMRARAAGVIVNVSSAAARVPAMPTTASTRRASTPWAR
jgi:NAD(P)-dependent dehydrogenase (short-subunit alcohol dehydrogenase family)